VCDEVGNLRTGFAQKGDGSYFALSAPPKPIEIIGSLLPPAVKWKAFFSRQSKNPKYLRDGDVVEATVATDDGAIDLGGQRNSVKYI